MKNLLFILFIVVIAGYFYHSNAFAQTTAVGSGQTVTIDAHGVCQDVTNNGGLTTMVPHRSPEEWASFRAGKPGNMSLVECVMYTACDYQSWVQTQRCSGGTMVVNYIENGYMYCGLACGLSGASCCQYNQGVCQGFRNSSPVGGGNGNDYAAYCPPANY